MTLNEKSWAERIREARGGGGFTYDDRLAIRSFDTCLVGEALKASGHAEMFNGHVMVSDIRLLELGAALHPHESPIEMVDTNLFSALEKHLAKVQARVDELYGEPPSVNLRFTEKEELVRA